MKGSTNAMTVPDTYKVIKSGTGYTVYQMGKIVIVRLEYVGNMTITGCPSSLGYYKTVLNGTCSANVGQATIYGTTVTVTNTSGISENMLGTLIYLSQ